MLLSASYDCPPIKRGEIPWLRFTSVHTNSSVVNKQTFEPGRERIPRFPRGLRVMPASHPGQSGSPVSPLWGLGRLQLTWERRQGCGDAQSELQPWPASQGAEAIWTFPLLPAAPYKFSPQVCGIIPPMGTLFLALKPLSVENSVPHKSFQNISRYRRISSSRVPTQGLAL